MAVAELEELDGGSEEVEEEEEEDDDGAGRPKAEVSFNKNQHIVSL